MRIRRITLERFRGVDAATVDFADGITIVEGPNEAGKSTIAEAISILFDHLDSSRRSEVRAVQQIGSDIGPYVELEFSIGEYDLTYAKRFLRRPSTMLTIATPRHEQIEGREAHDRMVTICKETLDEALWAAMRVAQGASLDQPDLADVGVLRAALDDSGSDGDSDVDLLERVAREYARYFTRRTGQPTGELSDAVSVHVAAQETYDRVKADLDAAEADVRRSAEIDAELAKLATESADHAARLADLRRQSRALETLRAAHAEASTALDTATNQLRTAGEAVAERTTMIAEAKERAETAAHIVEELAQLRSAADDARVRADEARTTATAARETARTCERAYRRSSESAQVIRLERESASLDERLDRAGEARDAILEAETVIGASQIDDAVLDRLVDLETATRTTRELQRLSAPTLEVEPLGLVDVEIDGAEPDDDGKRVVVGPTKVEVPGVVRMTVRPGRNDLDADVREADRALEVALDDVGETSVQAARDSLASLHEARASRDLARARLRDALGDAADYDALAAAAAGVRERHDQLRQRLGDDQQVGSEADTDAAVDAAREAYDEASAAADDHERIARERDVDVAELRESLAKAEQQQDSAAAELRRVEQRLADTRERTSDADLDTEVDRAREAVTDAGAERDRAARALDEARPDEIATFVSNAEAVEQRLARARREHEDEKQQIAGKLEATASRGLYDQVDDAAAALEHAENALARVERRADAARLLYDTLRSHRDTARRRYVAPFRDAIERLGSIVFGDDLSVEVSDDLQIVSRTAAGRTVAFESLSGGAREQLAILGRLAVASLVEPADGVPLILDDALGHADPVRLDRLAAVLNHAGRDLQVIVLTCHPERFRSVGSAETVRLGY